MWRGIGMPKDITNEQLFEFMTKMYGDLNGRIDSIGKEMQGMKGEMQGMKGEMQGMKGEIQGMKENMATKHDIVRLENKMDANHKALYDGYKLTYEN